MILLAFSGVLILSAARFLFFSANAQTQTNNCDSVLIPTIEQANSDYRLIQAHMFLNAESEYDRFRKIESGSEGADASYGAFSGEYKASKSKEGFSEKVRNRLKNENYSLDSSGSKSYTRRNLSDVQLAAWNKCLEINSNNRYVILATRAVDDGGFILVVDWKAQKGIGDGKLSIEVTNGLINNNSSLTTIMKGSSQQRFIVNRTGKNANTKVLVNIEGSSDDILVSYSLKPINSPNAGQKQCANIAGNWKQTVRDVTSTWKFFQPEGDCHVIGIDQNYSNDKIEFALYKDGNITKGIGYQLRKIGTCTTPAISILQLISSNKMLRDTRINGCGADLEFAGIEMTR